MIGLFRTRLSALKYSLILKRRGVQQALDDYRLLGMKEAELSYRYHWENVKFCVNEEPIYK
jgi:hypothetical protein